jgi:transcriptional regulator with XRE-family HTH domain
MRKQLGLSQEALAEITGVDQKTISDYEVGKGNPTANSISGLADALNTSADYLLGRTNDPTPPLPNSPGQLARKESRVIELWRQGKLAQAASLILNDEPELTANR